MSLKKEVDEIRKVYTRNDWWDSAWLSEDDAKTIFTYISELEAKQPRTWEELENDERDNYIHLISDSHLMTSVIYNLAIELSQKERDDMTDDRESTKGISTSENNCQPLVINNPPEGWDEETMDVVGDMFDLMPSSRGTIIHNINFIIDLLARKPKVKKARVLTDWERLSEGEILYQGSNGSYYRYEKSDIYPEQFVERNPDFFELFEE